MGRLMNWVVHPSTLFILVSGIMMFVEMGLGSDKPFWLIFMERGGTVVLLLSIVWVTLQGNKPTKKLEGKSIKKGILDLPVQSLFHFRCLVCSPGSGSGTGGQP